MSFLPLQLTQSERQTYGLRHQNYSKFRQHCVRKVAHLRAATNTQCKTSSSRNAKYKPFDKSKVALYTNQHLQVSLFEAERAWAASMEIKQSLDAESTARRRNQKSHLIRRLAKADKHASVLLQDAQQESLVLTDLEHLETIAYVCIIRGQLAFEKQQFEPAFNQFALAFRIITTLSESQGQDSKAGTESRYLEILDDVEPFLRVAHFKLGKEGDHIAAARDDVTALAEKTVPGVQDYLASYQRAIEKAGAKKKQVHNVEWRGHVFTPRSAESTAALSDAQTALQTLQRRTRRKRPTKPVADMEIYDTALTALGTSESTAKRLVEDNQISLAKTHSARFESAAGPLQAIHSYLALQLLSVRLDRDYNLINRFNVRRQRKVDRRTKAGKKNADRRQVSHPAMAKLYGSVIQTLESIREISLVDEDEFLSTAADTKFSEGNAQRCLHLAAIYAKASKFPEAVSLNQKASIYLRQARSSLSFLPQDDHAATSDRLTAILNSDEADLSALEHAIQQQETSINHSWFLREHQKSGDLTQDIGSLNLGQQKVKKPLFFDIAYNCVTNFDMQAIAAEAGMASPESVAGNSQVHERAVKQQQQDVEGEEGTKKSGGLWGFWRR